MVLDVVECCVPTSVELIGAADPLAAKQLVNPMIGLGAGATGEDHQQ
jgi:hypothetical protein